MENQNKLGFVHKNIIVTPLTIRAWNSHYKFFNFLYPFPVQFNFHNGRIFLHVDSILQTKYIPFLLAQVLITLIIGFGSCVFLLLFKFFHHSANLGVLSCIIFIFLGCAAFLELSLYVVCILGNFTLDKSTFLH